MKIKCENCGTEYDIDENPFCPNCGEYNEEKIKELEEEGE
jgi:threonine synthase